MSKKREFQELKKRVFNEYLTKTVREKELVLGKNASKKQIAISIAADLDFEDYMPIYKAIYMLQAENNMQQQPEE